MNLTKILELLPMDKNFRWHCIPRVFLSMLRNVFKDLKLDYKTTTLLYHLPHSEAAQLTVSPPDGVILKQLKAEDVPQVTAIYPFRSDTSNYLFQRRIRFNSSLGAYNRDNGELLGWCLRYETGVLTALQVEEKHKRNRYGELLLRAMSKEVGQQGDDVTACIVEGNQPSLQLFEKVGFKFTGTYICWLGFELNDMNNE